MGDMRSKRLQKAISCVILAIFACILIMVFQSIMQISFPTLFGYGIAQVKSGSMEPVIHVGDYVIVSTEANVAAGDIIMYENDHGMLITHRIITMYPDSIIVKGDANAAEDPPVHSSQIIGKIIYWGASPLDTYIENSALRFAVKAGILILMATLIQWAISNLMPSKPHISSGTVSNRDRDIGRIQDLPQE